MNKQDRWKQFGDELSMDFEPGLEPYVARAELFAKLHGEKIDVDLEQVRGMLGGFLETMVANMFPGILSGVCGGFEILIYRDVKHGMRSSGGTRDEYYMNCALIFPKQHTCDFTIVRGRRLLARNKIKFDEPVIDKLVTCTSKNPGTLGELLHNSTFKSGIQALYEQRGNFKVRSAGIIYAIQNRMAQPKHFKEAIQRMTDVAARLSPTESE